MTDIGFVFPGQGSQQVGMGKDIAQQYPAASDVFAQADDLLGFPLSRLCFEGPEYALTDTINAQPALLTTSIALLRAWECQAALPTPAYLAGHSMGEYTALVASGALTFADGLRLVRERGKLMKQAGETNPGSMAAVLGLERSVLAKVCLQASEETGQSVEIANDNAPGQVVISGHKLSVSRASELAKVAGARRVVPLSVSIASHSCLMLTIAHEFRQVVAATPIKAPRVPIVGNVDARPLTDVEAIRAELVNQLTSPVRWVESVEWMAAQGVTTFIEIGPGNVLTGLIRRIQREGQQYNVADMPTLSQTIQTLQTLKESDVA